MLVFHLLVCILVTTVRAIPEVKVGRTTISGRNIAANIEFFGGQTVYSIIYSRVDDRLQGYHLLSRLLAHSDFKNQFSKFD